MTYSIRYIRDDIVKTLNISVYKIHICICRFNRLNGLFNNTFYSSSKWLNHTCLLVLYSDKTAFINCFLKITIRILYFTLRYIIWSFVVSHNINNTIISGWPLTTTITKWLITHPYYNQVTGPSANTTKGQATYH